MDTSALRSLGWNPFFEQQRPDSGRDDEVFVRVAAHFGSRLLCMDENTEFSLPVQATAACGDLAVGDWIAIDPQRERAIRCLERESLIIRKAAGEKAVPQLIAANIDTLFIVSSCNDDFNLSRLERYLAIAAEADVHPVVVLTKSDLCDDPTSLRLQASRLMNGLLVETIDARDSEQTMGLASWCGPGQTVALVGSSGVGKSTLAMALGAGHITTQSIREDDSKGRHTTTARCIHRLDAGGLLIDTPGMRELQLTGCETGVAEVFDEIPAIAAGCRFRNCSHTDEPGCAVRAAIENGELDERRFESYRKLESEQARNAQSVHERREKMKSTGRFYKSVMAEKRRKRYGDE